MDWLIDWSIDWLRECLIDGLIDWWRECLIDELIDWLVDRGIHLEWIDRGPLFPEREDERSHNSGSSGDENDEEDGDNIIHRRGSRSKSTSMRQDYFCSSSASSEEYSPVTALDDDYNFCFDLRDVEVEKRANLEEEMPALVEEKNEPAAAVENVKDDGDGFSDYFVDEWEEWKEEKNADGAEENRGVEDASETTQAEVVLVEASAMPVEEPTTDGSMLSEAAAVRFINQTNVIAETPEIRRKVQRKMLGPAIHSGRLSFDEEVVQPPNVTVDAGGLDLPFGYRMGLAAMQKRA